MKPVVLYASRYGHTQRYAQWLGESLGCPVWNVKGLSPASLASYDTIVLGGSLYAGGMGGLSFLTRHAKAQKWVLFTCGVADPNLEVTRKNIRSNVEKALPENRRDTPLFFLRGGLDYSRLSPLHRLMMWALRQAILKKKDLTEEDRQVLHTYGKTLDFTRRETLQPILDFLQKA